MSIKKIQKALNSNSLFTPKTLQTNLKYNRIKSYSKTVNNKTINQINIIIRHVPQHH